MSSRSFELQKHNNETRKEKKGNDRSQKEMNGVFVYESG